MMLNQLTISSILENLHELEPSKKHLYRCADCGGNDFTVDPQSPEQLIFNQENLQIIQAYPILVEFIQTFIEFHKLKEQQKQIEKEQKQIEQEKSLEKKIAASEFKGHVYGQPNWRTIKASVEESKTPFRISVVKNIVLEQKNRSKIISLIRNLVEQYCTKNGIEVFQMQTVNDKAYRVDVIDKIIEYLIKIGRIYGTFGIKHTTLRYLTEDEFDKFKKGQFTLPHKKPLKPEDCLRKIGIKSNP